MGGKISGWVDDRLMDGWVYGRVDGHTDVCTQVEVS